MSNHTHTFGCTSSISIHVEYSIFMHVVDQYGCGGNGGGVRFALSSRPQVSPLISHDTPGMENLTIWVGTGTCEFIVHRRICVIYLSMWSCELCLLRASSSGRAGEAK